MPPCTRPFLMPSSALHPLTPYYATFSPMDTSPLTLATPPPLLPKKKEEGPEEGASNPAQGKLRPLSLLSTIQNGSAYDDHPDCAVFPAVKPPGANPTNASSPRPAPSHGLREGGTEVASNRALAPPWAPAT